MPSHLRPLPGTKRTPQTAQRRTSRGKGGKGNKGKGKAGRSSHGRARTGQIGTNPGTPPVWAINSGQALGTARGLVRRQGKVPDPAPYMVWAQHATSSRSCSAAHAWQWRGRLRRHDVKCLGNAFSWVVRQGDITKKSAASLSMRWSPTTSAW